MISRWELTGRQSSSQVDVIRVCVSARLFPLVLCAGNTLSDSNVLLTPFLSNAVRDDHQSTKASATSSLAQSRRCLTPTKGNRRSTSNWTDRWICAVVVVCTFLFSSLSLSSYNPICSAADNSERLKGFSFSREENLMGKENFSR